MSDEHPHQPDEAKPQPQDQQDDQAHQQATPNSPHQSETRPADTGGYDLAAGSQPATRGASGHRS